MTLNEAIKKALVEHGGVLTVEEICRCIEKGNLYRKGDGTLPDPSHVLLEMVDRLKLPEHLQQFEVIIRLRR